jgi:hypothetical protein
MALTNFQRAVCRLLADHRIASGESYIAGATALNELIAAPRVSMDIDLFHDADEALAVSWEADRALLEKHGYDVRIVRERPSFVEAEVSKTSETVLMQWVRDSAFRFFPLVQHADLGLALHPFDLATNKVLALVGRLEARDWIDLIHAGERRPAPRLSGVGGLRQGSGLQPERDPGAGVALGQVLRRRNPRLVVCGSGSGPCGSLAALEVDARGGRADRRHPAPAGSGALCARSNGQAVAGDVEGLRAALLRGALVFHSGRIRGALPQVKE